MDLNTISICVNFRVDIICKASCSYCTSLDASLIHPFRTLANFLDPECLLMTSGMENDSSNVYLVTVFMFEIV